MQNNRSFFLVVVAAASMFTPMTSRPSNTLTYGGIVTGLCLAGYMTQRKTINDANSGEGKRYAKPAELCAAVIFPTAVGWVLDRVIDKIGTRNSCLLAGSALALAYHKPWRWPSAQKLFDKLNEYRQTVF